MTPRERLFAALAGRPTDRVPVWLLFPYHPAPYYADVRATPCYAPILAAADRCGTIVLDRRNPGVPLFTPDVAQRRVHFTEGGWEVTQDRLECGSVCLHTETRRRGDEIRRKPLLASEADLRAFAALPFNTDPATIRRQLAPALETCRTEAREFPTDQGAVMFDAGEPVGVVYGRSDLEEYAVWSLTCPEVVEGILERAMVQKRIVYECLLAADIADVYFLVGSELASPPLVSRATFRRWVVPYAQELIARIRHAGKRVIQHYHGQVRALLRDFVDMAPDGLHTIEAPPTGDCTLEQAYDVVGDRITLIGNVQYDEFRSRSPAEMEAEVRRLLAVTRGRRFILSPTAGPYEPTISPRLVDNYLALLRAAG